MRYYVRDHLQHDGIRYPAGTVAEFVLTAEQQRGLVDRGVIELLPDPPPADVALPQADPVGPKGKRK